MSKIQLDIRLRLNGEVKRRFLKIKENLGLTNNTEVLRLIIKEYYDKEGSLTFGSKLTEDSK